MHTGQTDESGERLRGMWMLDRKMLSQAEKTPRATESSWEGLGDKPRPELWSRSLSVLCSQEIRALLR